MKTDANLHAGSKRVFRLVYTSRAKDRIHRSAAVQLANDAASRNFGNQVSGVLFSEHGIFLQWLEGPADRVCALMSRIASDPRHTDVAILNAGWAPERCYSAWPMQLAELPLARLRSVPKAPAGTATACDSVTAAGAFAGMKALYQQQQNRGEGWPQMRELAERLIYSSSGPLPDLPDALLDMRARVQLVDDLAVEFMLGWQADCWTSIDIALGFANLHRCWQFLGRASEPFEPRQRVAVILPPGNSEMIGATAAADLLRSSGVSVRVYFEPSAKRMIRALARKRFDALVISGSRIGWPSESACERELTHTIGATFPQTRTHLASRLSGPLVALPDRLFLERHDAGALPAESDEWQYVSAMASRIAH